LTFSFGSLLDGPAIDEVMVLREVFAERLTRLAGLKLIELVIADNPVDIGHTWSLNVGQSLIASAAIDLE